MSIQTWETSVTDPKLRRTKQVLFCCQHEPQIHVVYSTQQLVDYINAHHVPFFVKHQRQTTLDMFFGLVTELYTCNNRVCFKVLYPYDPQHLAIGRLYTQLSAASSAMYADYSLHKTREVGSTRPCVETPNSNGWEHLLAQLPCAHTNHEHQPYAYSLHLNHMLPSKMREALRQGIPCEINLSMLPQPVVVTHGLQLDHLIDANDTLVDDDDLNEKSGVSEEDRLKSLACNMKQALLRVLRQQKFSLERQSQFFDVLRDCQDHDILTDTASFRIVVSSNPTAQRKRKRAVKKEREESEEIAHQVLVAGFDNKELESADKSKPGQRWLANEKSVGRPRSGHPRSRVKKSSGSQNK